jgi:hypothetical protein
MKRIALFIALFVTTSAFAQAQDVITIPTVTGSGIVQVPVYLRDTAGTPLGIDQSAGSRIQSFSVRVTYSPASAVQSIGFTRSGITAPLTPMFESSPSAPGSVSLLASFDEGSNLIPFASNAALPGDEIGRLVVALSPTAVPGSTITLTLDPVLTQLTDEGGSPATIETVGNGRLSLVSGAIRVASANVPTLSEWALGVFIASLAVIALRFRM